MYKKAEIFYIHTLTPTHVGSGQDLGIVDMPIQRESHTNYPKIEGSSLKGSIREAFEKQIEDNEITENKIHAVFGFDDTNASKKTKKVFEDQKDKFAGAIGFSDARILLFPVKSAKGVFAWVTCPYAVERYKKDLEIAGKKDLKWNTPPSNSMPELNNPLVIEAKVILEEYTFEVKEDTNTKSLAEFLSEQTGITEIKDKLVVLSDDDFKDFVEMFTEVITRTRINNNTGTVADGALFTEEYLPAETVMYSLVMASPIMAQIDEVEGWNENKILEFFKKCPEVIQIGGNATIGKGICEIKTKGNKNG
jgi:CRISPR-associated protein Cmr4